MRVASKEGFGRKQGWSGVGGGTGAGQGREGRGVLVTKVTREELLGEQSK